MGPPTGSRRPGRWSWAQGRAGACQCQSGGGPVPGLCTVFQQIGAEAGRDPGFKNLPFDKISTCGRLIVTKTKKSHQREPTMTLSPKTPGIAADRLGAEVLAENFGWPDQVLAPQHSLFFWHK